jgi:hypothetical protein
MTLECEWEIQPVSAITGYLLRRSRRKRGERRRHLHRGLVSGQDTPRSTRPTPHSQRVPSVARVSEGGGFRCHAGHRKLGGGELGRIAAKPDSPLVARTTNLSRKANDLIEFLKYKQSLVLCQGQLLWFPLVCLTVFRFAICGFQFAEELWVSFWTRIPDGREWGRGVFLSRRL